MFLILDIDYTSSKWQKGGGEIPAAIFLSTRTLSHDRRHRGPVRAAQPDWSIPTWLTRRLDAPLALLDSGVLLQPSSVTSQQQVARVSETVGIK